MTVSSKLIQAAAGAGGEPDLFILSLEATSGESLNGIDVDTNGDIVACGFFNDPVGAGGYDAGLVKVNSIGEVLWSKVSGTSNSDYLQDCVTDSNDNIYVVGYYTDSNTGCLIQKYAPDGTITWTRGLDGTYADRLYACDISADDSKIYFCGYHDASTSFPNSYYAGYLGSSGSGTADYRLQWSYSATGQGICVTPNYVYTVGTGYVGTTGSWPQIARHSQTNMSISSRRLTSTTSQVTSANAVAPIGSSNDVILLGRYPGGAGKYGLLIQRITSGLAITWSRRFYSFTTTYSMQAKDVVTDSDDNIYILATGTGTTCCIVKYDADGNYQWANELDGVSGQNVSPNKISLDQSGDYFYVAGTESITPAAMIFKAPTDGSKTGTYGSFVYRAVPTAVDGTYNTSTQADDALYLSATLTLKAPSFTTTDISMTTSLEEG